MGIGSALRSFMRRTTSGSFSASATAAENFSATAVGVFGGATTPNHASDTKPGKRFRHRRDVVERGDALFARHRERPQLAAAHVRQRDAEVVEHDLHLAAEQIGERGRGALVRHVRDAADRRPSS